MTKNELRKLLRERRKTVPDGQKKELDAAIVQQVAASKLFQNASMLLLYAPMEGEINLLPLARIARERNIPIAFPRCDTERGTMEFYLLNTDARLTKGAYGIPEPPADAPICVPDKRALCILPGLSFDPAGNRLGYGKGYYDRYLATFPGVTVGAVYSRMMLRSIPTAAHDLPAVHLVTEHGFRQVAPSIPAQEAAHSEQESQADKASARKSQTAKDLVNQIKGAWKALWQARSESTVKPLHAPLALVLCTFVLLLLSRPVDANLLDRENEYIGVILLQILIFAVPAVLYCKIKGEKFSDRIRMRLIQPSHLFFLLFLLVVMITGSLLTSILTGWIETLSGNFTLYGTFVAHMGGTAETVYAILAYALLPAFCEELVFRSLLCAEYEKYGVGVSVTVSALCFAMLHFSFQLFFTYLLLGVLLAGAMYVTRSFLAPFLLHLGYNIFCLFGQPYLSAFYVNAGSNEIFLFCLIVLFLLFAAFAAGEARKIYHIYAKKNADSSYTTAVPFKLYPQHLLFSVLSPLSAVCLAVWLTVSIVRLLT